MRNDRSIEADVLIFGGGAAGLWLLDDLSRRGYSVMLAESRALGTGQTVASQGIIHGGLKYTLAGLMTPSAEAVRAMPALWRECLEGQREPDLSAVALRAPFCHLWRTASFRSQVGMVGARLGLRVKPVTIDSDERPAILRDCPGEVARLDEQVIDPSSLVLTLAVKHEANIVHVAISPIARHERVLDMHHLDLLLPDGSAISCRARTIVLAAGIGNDDLRITLGLASGAQQSRPLHMVMVRGERDQLPVLNGHCVDGNRTRITITTAVDSRGRHVWQVGGQVAENGVGMDAPSLIAHAWREIQAAIPGATLNSTEWATYHATRAEPATRGGVRPDDAWVASEAGVITAWPTKLALVPRLVDRVRELLPAPSRIGVDGFADLPHPASARPPFEEERSWFAAPSA